MDQMRNHAIGTVTVIAVGLLIAACGINPSKPTPKQLAVADYGAMPTRYEAVIHKYFAEVSKDPDSVQYRAITAPEKGYVIRKAPFSGIYSFDYGWQVMANVNGKNSYGGYTGFKIWSFMFRGDEIINVQAPE
jgi:hypothetical protein